MDVQYERSVVHIEISDLKRYILSPRHTWLHPLIGQPLSFHYWKPHMLHNYWPFWRVTFSEHAIIKPLYKSKEKYLLTNYRPISLLLTLSKVLEKLMHFRISGFLENKRIFLNECIAWDVRADLGEGRARFRAVFGTIGQIIGSWPLPLLENFELQFVQRSGGGDFSANFVKLYGWCP